MLEPASFSDQVADLDNMIDWELMKSRYWADTPEEPDRRERRMAEFLVHKRVPWEAIQYSAPSSGRSGSATAHPSGSEKTMSLLAAVPSAHQAPKKVGPGTYVIQDVQHALGAPLSVYLNSAVIQGAEPIIVDTGSARNRDR